MRAASPSRMVGRGLLRHCPRCGGGKIFSSWFRLRERCPTCGMRFEREEGFWLGGYVINIAAGEGALLILLAVLIAQYANGSTVAVWPYAIAGTAIAIGGPVVTFPYSRTIWCAIYLIMKPLSPDEVIDAQSFVARQAIGDGAGDGPITEASGEPPAADP